MAASFLFGAVQRQVRDVISVAYCGLECYNKRKRFTHCRPLRQCLSGANATKPAG